MTETKQPDLVAMADQIVKSPFLNLVGIRLEEIQPGYSRLRLHVRPELLNIHDVAHGGASFTLADVTAALALRSLGANIVTIQASLNYLSPGPADDDLISEGRVVHLGKRTAVAQVTISTSQGQTTAHGTFTFQRLAGGGNDTLVTQPLTVSNH